MTFSFGLLLLLAGCTKPPPIPELSSREPLPVERLALSDRIRGHDLREIIGALNENNRLQAIGNLINNATEGELDTVADLLSDYFYLDVGIPNALPDLIDQRFRQKGFSSWLQATERWKQSGKIVPLARFAKYLTNLPEFRKCVEQDGKLLNPRLAVAFNRVRDESTARFHPSLAFSPESVPAPLLVDDIAALLSSDKFTDELLKVGRDWDDKEVGGAFLRALISLRTDFSGISAFEGFARSLSTLLVSRRADDPVFAETNQLEQLFRLGATLDEGSTALLKKVHHDELVPPLTQALHEYATRAYGGWMRTALQGPQFNLEFWKDFVRKKADGPPTAQFNKVFRTLLQRMEWLTGPPLQENTPLTISTNEYIYLGAFVMTKWLEKAIEKNPELVAKEGNLWNASLISDRVEIDFIEQKGTTLSFPQRNDLQALGLGAFASQMEISFDHQKNLKPYQFPIELDALTDNLSKALPAVANQIDSVRNYGNQNDPVYMLGAAMAKSGGEAKPLNLMDSINLVAGIVPHPWFHDVTTAIIVDSGLSDLASSDIETKLAQFMSYGEVHETLKQIFYNIPALAAFDRSVGGLPSGLHLYQTFASKLRAEPHTLTELFTLLSHSNVAHAKWNAAESELPIPQFPGMHRWIRHGEALAKILFSLSLPTAAERSLILETLGSIFAPSESESDGLWLHVQLLKRAFREQKELITQVWEVLQGEGLGWVFDLKTWTGTERQFTSRFLKEGGLDRLWDFLQGHSESTRLLGVVKDLKKLQQAGELEHTFHLLAFVHDTRLKRVAELFLRWNQTGEMKAFLDVLETWLEAAK